MWKYSLHGCKPRPYSVALAVCSPFRLIRGRIPRSGGSASRLADQSGDGIGKRPPDPLKNIFQRLREVLASPRRGGPPAIPFSTFDRFHLLWWHIDPSDA